ncbi:hypothetical protein GI584_04910 [Gracilibacillus salitolerans]|uniref:Uncharacterized protein n=1 Tax=Gracilibacillus salitolerans TaxID=2663022 RepID=A0A5Q2TFM2_9BACI|nr:hypothetical protein [Gracilibacillus salitolerans]QGH33415.1 hypothetical protein GI584_04910 [Gracilibacillus salitolerans]
MAKIFLPLYVFLFDSSLIKEAISYFKEASYWFALLGGLFGILLIISLDFLRTRDPYYGLLSLPFL